MVATRSRLFARWSMERQVRVAVGALVLTFCGLGLLTSKKFFVGVGLVSTGLIYAGISDTCILASVLGRMPWNALDFAHDLVPTQQRPLAVQEPRTLPIRERASPACRAQ